MLTTRIQSTHTHVCDVKWCKKVLVCDTATLNTHRERHTRKKRTSSMHSRRWKFFVVLNLQPSNSFHKCYMFLAFYLSPCILLLFVTCWWIVLLCICENLLKFEWLNLQWMTTEKLIMNLYLIFQGSGSFIFLFVNWNFIYCHVLSQWMISCTTKYVVWIAFQR